MKTKKLLCVLLTLMMVMPLVSIQSSAVTTQNDVVSQKAVGFPTRTVAYDLPFDDVDTDSWYFEAVNYAYHNNITGGTAENTFSPGMSLTRAMFVTLIGAMNNIDKTQYADDTPFSDVGADTYYAPYVNWAYENEIVSGVDEGVFAPNAQITREQLALMLYKLAVYTEKDTSARAVLDSYTDADNISGWASDAFSWCVKSGIISGTGETTLSPAGGSTRAQTVTMLYAYIRAYILRWCSTFSVSREFGSDMIIQRGEKITVWGWSNVVANPANVGSCVYVNLGGKAAGIATVTEDGSWKVVLDRILPASNAQMTMNVSGSTSSQTKSYNGILCGDVYLFIGQSNIWYSMDKLINDTPTFLQSEIAPYSDELENVNVRLFRSSSDDIPGDYIGYPSSGSNAVYDDVTYSHGWLKPAAGAGAFSALGFIFGRRLSEDLEVPVGLMQVDASGYSLATFSPGELCEAWGIEEKRDGEEIYRQKIVHTASRFVYNQLINPLLNTSICGLVWYQGETDEYNTYYSRKTDSTYANQFADLMNYLRENMACGDFPVYIMEFPALFGNLLNFGNIRTEMGRIPNILDNSYLISSSDVWKDTSFAENYHPYCKPAQADRLLKTVKALNYGGDLDKSAAPQVLSVDYTSGKTAVVTYTYTAGYLRTNPLNSSLKGFEVCTNLTSNTWVDASSATITASNQVTVNGTSAIYGVRYHSVNRSTFPEDVNLASTTGIPALAFADYRDCNWLAPQAD